ncbi:MAG: hypothetical protein JNK29_19575 [Anaerolineales bacterium]|nr:hypothetical protein [Anaerolineales bacterium]
MPTPPARAWPLTAGAFLLAAQGAALAATGVTLLQYAAPAPAWDDRAPPALVGGLCLALSAVAVLNALRFLRRAPAAWLTALLLQGLSLSLALLLYWRGQRSFSYPMMVVGICLVLYLNRGDVAALFRPAAGPELPPLPRSADDE